MIWLNPAALVALAAIAAPILIHILVQRRAERIPFPTLRFLQPTRLAAIRRHVLEDAALLAVRAAILAAAVAALAGPLLVTGARRDAWSQRVVRATVVDEVVTAGRGARPRDRAPDRPAPYQAEEVVAAPLPDGIARAVAWLEHAPPAQRELVIVSPFPLGSLTAADLAAIPADVGIRFERDGTLPATSTISIGRVLALSGRPEGLRYAAGLAGSSPVAPPFRAAPVDDSRDAAAVIARGITLDGPWTSVHETATSDRIAWPIDVVSSPDAQPIVDAAIAAVLSQRVPAPGLDHRARLVVGAPAGGPPIADVTPVAQPWMAEAIAAIGRDPDVGVAAGRVPAGLSDARFAATPWEPVARAGDGRPLAVAAGSPNRLVMVSAAPAADVVTPVLLRAIASAIAQPPDLRRAEVLAIQDAVLQRWSREPTATATPRIDAVDDDDRRWLWAAALGLLAIETWMRRARRRAAPEDRADGNVEAARVA